MNAAQVKGFPLAGMTSGHYIYPPDMAAGNLTKPDIESSPGAAGLLSKVDIQNLRKPEFDAESASSFVTSTRGLATGNRFDTAAPGVSLAVREGEALTLNKVVSYAQAKLLKSYGLKKGGNTQAGLVVFLESVKKGGISNPPLCSMQDDYQPFGSMPKRSSSLRPSVLSQLAKLTPDSAATDSNCSLSSGVIRILNCGDCPSPFGLLSRFIIDRWSPIKLISPLLGGHLIIVLPIKTMPRSGGTLTGHLTTSVIISNEEAVLNHTTHPQGRNAHDLNSEAQQPSFIWLIAAVPRNCQTITAKIHHIEAQSEREARQSLARDHVTFFAGRIRKGGAYAH